MALTLEQLNTADAASAVQMLDGLYENSPWIAQTALALRPFASLAHLKYAMVQVLEGTGCFTVDGEDHLVHPGEVLVMPANVPHAVSAPEAFKWVLTVVFPEGFKK